jgi:3-oxoacyl-[acyl-carrier protein] reductase
MMKEYFTGKCAIVTGASRGIGLAIARSLAANGVNLGLFDVGDLSHLEAEFSSYGIGILPVAVDVTDFESVQKGVSAVAEKFGGVDFLVNNAGITRDNLLIRMSQEEWDAVIDTNLKGTFHCAKAVCRLMMKKRFGVIINISSVVGLMGNPGQVNYSASKAGVIGLTKTLARELASRSIRVNGIAPGFIQSAMTDKLPDKVKEELMGRIPLGVLGEADDVASCVVFLLSPMARYITGSIIQVDGGMNM